MAAIASRGIVANANSSQVIRPKSARPGAKLLTGQRVNRLDSFTLDYNSLDNFFGTTNHQTATGANDWWGISSIVRDQSASPIYVLEKILIPFTEKCH